jgi:VanZ family protein
VSQRTRSLIFFYIPPWIWALALLIGTSIPTTYLPSVVVLTPDKLLHLGAFFGLAIFVFRALGHMRRDESDRRIMLRTFLLCFGYAVFDEAHQYFIPGRQPDVYDIIADLIGILLALFFLKLLPIVGRVPDGAGLPDS